MEVGSQRNRHEDHVSNARSFGSNYQQCSQSRKMSVGIAAASSANVSSISGNRYNPKGQKGSPWVSPKPLAKSKTVSDVFNPPKKVRSIEAVGGKCSNLGTVTEPTAGMGLQSGNCKQKNGDTVIPGKERNKDVINPDRGKGLTKAVVEDISIPDERFKVNQPKLRENRSKETLKMKLWEVLRTAPPIEKEPNPPIEKEPNPPIEKEPNPPIEKEPNGSGSVEVDANVSSEDPSFKPKVNSDTIETDSENPELAVSRPVTRSLSRKKGSTVACPKSRKRLRKKLFPPTDESNVFTFDEKINFAQNAATGRHLQCKTYSTGKKNLNIRIIQASDPPPQMSNIKQASSGSKRASVDKEISLRSGIGIPRGNQERGRMKQAVRKKNSHSSPEANDSGQLKEGNERGRMKQAVRRENSHSSPEANDSGQLKEGNDPIFPEKGGKEDHINCASEPRIANLINDILGPVNKVKRDVSLPKPSAQEKETQEQTYTRMLARKIIFVKDAFRFKSNLTEKQMNLGSHCKTESSNDPTDSDDTVQSMKEKHDTEVFTSGRRKSNKAELSIKNGFGENMDFTPVRAKFSDFSPIMHLPNVAGEKKGNTPGTDDFENERPRERKQLELPPRFNLSELSPLFCFPDELLAVKGSEDDSGASSDDDLAEKHISSPVSNEVVNFNDMSPTFYSPIATRLTDASQENQGNDVERAVAVFGCALEKFKTKLVSSTKKRSLEVMECTAEEIQSKFLSAKSQIEKDVTKLANASASKRQTLEKSFNEKQEQLHLIHEKYRNEIQRHIYDYTRTVESMEAHGKDLKQVIERRKVSHQKLLMQVEEAVENHLSDAQRELMSIHKQGRSKMQHLKIAIARCLEDGIFT